MGGSEHVAPVDQRAAAPELAPLAAVQVDGRHPRPGARLGLSSPHDAPALVFTLAAFWKGNFDRDILAAQSKFSDSYNSLVRKSSAILLIINPANECTFWLASIYQTLKLLPKLS